MGKGGKHLQEEKKVETHLQHRDLSRKKKVSVSGEGKGYRRRSSSLKVKKKQGEGKKERNGLLRRVERKNENGRGKGKRCSLGTRNKVPHRGKEGWHQKGSS